MVVKSLKTSIYLNLLCTVPALPISLLFWTSLVVPASVSNYSVQLILTYPTVTEPLLLRTTHSASEETQDDRQRLHYVIFVAGHRHQRHWCGKHTQQYYGTELSDTFHYFCSFTRPSVLPVNSLDKQGATSSVLTAVTVITAIVW